MAIDPATARLIAKLAYDALATEEGRKKTVRRIMIAVSIIVFVLAILISLLNAPIALISGFFSQNDLEQLNGIRSEVVGDSNLVFKGTYPLPMVGELDKTFKISSYFGEERSYVDINGVTHTDKHNAIDFTSIDGNSADLIAITEGKVVVANTKTSTLGNWVMIEHKDEEGKTFYSVYGHMSAVYVKEGQQVEQGLVIGKEGGGANDPNPGQTTGRHLHFEITLDRARKQKIDPAPYLFNEKDEVKEEKIEEIAAP